MYCLLAQSLAGEVGSMSQRVTNFQTNGLVNGFTRTRAFKHHGGSLFIQGSMIEFWTNFFLRQEVKYGHVDQD